MTEEFRLNQIERSSAVWTRIKAHLETELALLRERNDRSLEAIETATLRGEIKAVKIMLYAGDEPDTTVYD